MIEPLSIIKLDEVRSAPLRADPFPFVVIESLLRAEYAQDVLRDFPVINSRGFFPLKKVKYGKTFDRLVEELKSPALKSAIAEKFIYCGIALRQS